MEKKYFYLMQKTDVLDYDDNDKNKMQKRSLCDERKCCDNLPTTTTD